MKKAFEIIGGLLILFFIGVVIWQSTTDKDSDNLINQPPAEVIEEGITIVPDESTIPDEKAYVCTMDAKMCSDGSFVGRTGPDCEFSTCPVVVQESVSEDGEIIICGPEYRAHGDCPAYVDPVCAFVEVQCITTPCYPVREQFNNDCEACSIPNVTSYIKGECA